MAREIQATDFETEVLESNIPVLVDFFAEWCGPCRMLGPVLEELGTKAEGKVKIVKVNVDNASSLAAKFGVMSIPTIIAFKNGEKMWQETGFRSLESLEELVNKL